MRNKIAKILRDNLIYCDCFVSEKGYDDVINSTTDLITEMFAEYEKQARIDENKKWMENFIGLEDRTAEELYGIMPDDFSDRIKELKDKL